MCTILLLRHLHPDWPLVLAANRDELYARPATGPQVLLTSSRAIGGRDLERQGTWMGVTDGGLFVGLTNQKGSSALARGLRSRGEVVLEALEAGGVEAVERYLEGLRPSEYQPFNLLYGTAEVLRVAYARPDAQRVRWEDVPRGVHVLPNDVLDSPALPKVARARGLAESLAHKPWPELAEGLQRILADHLLPGLDSLCIHTPGYGTRSSAIVALAPGRVAHYLASDTAPCQGPFRDVTGLLQP